MGNKSTKTGNNVVDKDNFVAVDDSMLISNSGSDLLHKETCSSNDVADERRGVLIVTDSGSMPSKLSLSKVSLTETESPTSSVVSSVTDGILPLGGDIKREFAVRDWDGLKMYSDFVREGLQQLGQETDGVLMLYESPSSSSENTSFHNSQVFNYVSSVHVCMYLCICEKQWRNITCVLLLLLLLLLFLLLLGVFEF